MTHPEDDAPVADVVEQETPADPIDTADDEAEAPALGLEVPEWDASEQSIAVPLDDDARA